MEPLAAHGDRLPRSRNLFRSMTNHNSALMLVFEDNNLLLCTRCVDGAVSHKISIRLLIFDLRRNSREMPLERLRRPSFVSGYHTSTINVRREPLENLFMFRDRSASFLRPVPERIYESHSDLLQTLTTSSDFANCIYVT